MKGEASGGWRGDLEGHRGLTCGVAAGVQSPRHFHAVAAACGWSATELNSFPFQRLTKPTDS
jgi:hypothetical protein